MYASFSQERWIRVPGEFVVAAEECPLIGIYSELCSEKVKLGFMPLPGCLEDFDLQLQMQQKEVEVSKDKMEKQKEEDYPLILICYV